jgi:hypothetical protein
LEIARRAVSAESTSTPITAAQLQRLTHGFCAEAKRQQLDAASVLITLKKLWSDSPDVRLIRGKRNRDELLARVVTACISEYYAE